MQRKFFTPKLVVPYLLIIAGFLISSCEDPEVKYYAECIGFDGVPVHVSMQQTCCDEGTPKKLKPDADKAQCMGAIISNIQNSIQGAETNLQAAAAGIRQTAANLGVQVNMPATIPSTIQKKPTYNNPNKITKSTFGATEPGFGSAGLMKGAGDSANGLNTNPNSAGGAAGGASGNTNGAGGSGLSFSSGGSGAKTGSGSWDAGIGKTPTTDGELRYAMKTREQRDSGNTSGVGVGTNSGAGLDFGSTTSAESEMNANTDEAPEGESEDPADYFSRTRKNDSLFLIVESRYRKKMPKLMAKSPKNSISPSK